MSDEHSYKAWWRAYETLYDALPAGAAVPCPRCGDSTLRLVFVGSPESRLASGYLWCERDLLGIAISRTHAPEGAVLLDIGLDWDELNRTIPDFEVIRPDEDGENDTDAE